MHIALLFEFPTLLGGERSLLAALDELRRQQVSATFSAIAPADGPLAGALAKRGLRHVPWSVRDAQGVRRPLVPLESSLMEIVRVLQPDVLHANSLSMGRLTGRIADRLKCPATAHLRDIIGLSAAAMADLNCNAGLIAVSQATRAFHVSQGLDAARTCVLHNGIDLARFAPRPATGWLHRELRLRPNVRMIAAIGQIGLRKGWDVLIEAYTRTCFTEPVHLLLIGTRHSEKAESRQFEIDLRDRLLVAGCQNRVHWLGERPDVEDILPELDLLVHPARQEPLGRVLIEALACGVPIVATDVGGTREIIEPDSSGRLVPAGDATALANAIVDLLRDRQTTVDFRVAARKRAEQFFDTQQTARDLWACWEALALE